MKKLLHYQSTCENLLQTCCFRCAVDEGGSAKPELALTPDNMQAGSEDNTFLQGPLFYP